MTVTGEGPAKRKTSPVWRAVQIVFSLVIVVGIFVYAIPKFADYSKVWTAINEMTVMEIAAMVGVTILNLVTYWPQQTAAMPGLTIAQAAVNNQTSTSIANTLPGGGAIAVGVSYTMYRSWGFPNAAIGLSVLVTGIWNIFMKLGMPIVAIGILAISGQSSAGLLVAALIGLVVLLAAIVLFAMMLWKKELAKRIGDAVGKPVSFLRRIVRKPPVTGWGEAAVRFRRLTIDLVATQWVKLTLSTVVSHLCLFLVLLLALRNVGVSEQEISTPQVLAVFAFGRLITALPITPGGFGLIELGYIGGLVLAGQDHADVSPEFFKAQVAAAVLVFRALTFLFQIPLGGLTYLIWRAKKSWLKPVPLTSEPDAAIASPAP
ncbi:MAG TPA: YbhN family protein [Actinomycetota bacterium]|nr:YbhN family protein [Actinomycetota bacterium]